MKDASRPVKSAVRVLDIFELLSGEPDGLSATEIASRLGMPRSSAHVLVQTLAGRGYLRPEGRDQKRFTLGVELVQLGLSVSDRLELRTVARGVLERLVASWHETVLLAAADNGDLVYVDKVVSDRFGFRTDPRLSARRPLHSHSLGKALLAALGDGLADAIVDGKGLERVTEFTIVDDDELREDLRRTRERGYAMDEQEAVLGVCCVGAPIRDYAGDPIGAVSMSTIREYYRPDVTGPAVRDAAVEISRAMGWTGSDGDLYATDQSAREALDAGETERTPTAVRT